MEFSLLKQFKNDILEHNVLNGRDSRFEGKLMQIGEGLFVITKSIVTTQCYVIEF